MTREALQAPQSIVPAHLCLKNCDGRFGLIEMNDLIAHRWIVTDRTDGLHTSYGSARALVAAGWVID
jgi:hypothetical protein